MNNAFETLGIEVRLRIDDESLRAAFREAGKLAHPDAGGGDEQFAQLREAFDIISSPARRLRHWLELAGCTVDPRGTVEPSLMDLFSEVGAATQQAEVLVRRRSGTQSALGLAMLEGETQKCREAVEAAIRKVEEAITLECTGFGEFEESGVPDAGRASKTVRNLTFLEKWRSGLRGVFGRLV